MILLITVIIAFFVCEAVSRHFRKNCLKKLMISISFKQKGISVGEKGVIEEILINSKKMELPNLELKYATDNSFLFGGKETNAVSDKNYRKDVFCMGGMQKITREITFTASERGYFGIESVDVLARDYFMNSPVSCLCVSPAHIYVYPERVDTSFFRPDFIRMSGEAVVKKRIEEDPFVFRTIRQYVPGDEINHINWRATAASDELMVNTYESTGSNKVCLILDKETAAYFYVEEALEGIISLASSLTARFIRENVSVAVLGNMRDGSTGKLLNIPFGAGKKQESIVDTALAKIDLKKQGDVNIKEIIDVVIEEYGQNVTYILISSNRDSDIDENIRDYRAGGYSICAVAAFPEREKGRIVTSEGSTMHIIPWEVPKR